MKTVTIREAQHNFARILQAVEAGEPVEILRRKTPVARLVPIATGTEGGDEVNWEGHADRMASLWGDTLVANVDAVLEDLRGDGR